MEDSFWKDRNWHVHTTASDGRTCPKEVVRKAKKSGLREIAITDHDTFDGIKEAAQEGKKLGINVIPGVELTCYEYWDGRRVEIHIKGIGVDINNKTLKALVEKAAVDRKNRAKLIVEKLRKLGYNISWKEVKSFGKTLIARPHIAIAFLSNKQAVEKFKRRFWLNEVTFRDIFNNLIGDGRPAYVEKMHLSPKKAISIIKNAGGIAEIAHPGGEKNVTPELTFDAIKRYKKYGLDSLEVYYPSHTRKQLKRFIEIAKKLNLKMTTGTDFHGRDTDSMVYRKK